jgi:hypothetical protein
LPRHCPECGAPVPDGGSCRDNFHALLLLEAEVPGAPGSILHFYVVATFVLQHPDSMNYTAEALAGLRATHADALAGRLTRQGILQRVRRAADGPARVTRRAGEPPPAWRRGGWPLSVEYVLDGGAGAFAERVVHWARSVRETFDSH